MRLRFLHLADAHLGCRNFYLAEKARERTEDFRLALRDAVEFALEPRNAIDAVLIPGNLFEYHRPEIELWNFAKGLLSRLLAKNIVVAMVPGHHDSLAYKNSVYRTERLPGVELFLETEPSAPRVHEIRGQRVYFYGVAFVPGQTPLPLPSFAKRSDHGLHVALLHARREPLCDASKVHELTIDPMALADTGLDYVACGGEAEFREERVGRTTVCWAGVAEGQGYGQGMTGEKGHVIVEFDDEGVHIERLIRNRRTISETTIDLRDERITSADALKDVIMTHAGADRITSIRLTGTAEFIADLDEISDAVQDAFFHLEIHDESRLVDSALLRKIESENTIRGYFVRKLALRIAEIKRRIVKEGHGDVLARELKVHENAMKIGVEQFVEEEAPADSIYSLIPDGDETVGGESLRSRVGIPNLEEKVKAMLEYRRKLNSEMADREVDDEEEESPHGVRRRPAAGPGTNGHHKAESAGLELEEEL